MNARELIKILQDLPDEELPVYVHDGMDPSDPQEAVLVKGGMGWWSKDLPCIQILS